MASKSNWTVNPDGSKTKTRSTIGSDGKTYTKTKTIGPDGRKEKTRSVTDENRSVVTKKVKSPTGYKEKVRTVTTPSAVAGKKNVSVMKKEKGVPPGRGFQGGTKMMTDRGKMYRKKMKTATDTRHYKYGSTETMNQKLKESIGGFKQRQRLSRETGYDRLGKKMSETGKYMRVNPVERIEKYTYKKGGQKEMIKRADGSYSQRGLWDNIRANKGSGKKPTKQMLKQERKIKAKSN